MKIYYVLDGILTVLNNNRLIKYDKNQLFWVHDYDDFKLIEFTGTLICLTLNNFYYYEITNNLALAEVTNQTHPSPISVVQQFNTIINTETTNISYTIQAALHQLIQYIFYLDLHHKSIEAKSSSNTIIQTIVKHINQSVTNNHSCLWFARHYYLNYSYLSREFSIFMSCPLSEYILGCKIHASACEIDRGFPLEQILKKYNFKSQQDYITHSKKFHCYSPHEIIHRIVD